MGKQRRRYVSPSTLSQDASESLCFLSLTSLILPSRLLNPSPFLKHSISLHILSKTLQWLPNPLRIKSKLLAWASLRDLGLAHFSALISYHASVTLLTLGQLISLGNSTKHSWLVPAARSLYFRDLCLEHLSPLGFVCLAPVTQREAFSEHPV